MRVGDQKIKAAGSRWTHQIPHLPSQSRVGVLQYTRTSLTPMYLAQELAPEVLEAAEKITLRDLLESPAYQAWLMSALGNAHRFRLQFKGSDSHLDEYTQFRADRVFSAITSEQKQLSYEATNEIIRNNKQDRVNANR